MKQTLLTTVIRQQLTKNGLESVPEAKDHMPVVHLFSSNGRMDILLSELLPEDDDIAFGLLDNGSGRVASSFISLTELESMRDSYGYGIERDILFKARHPLSTYLNFCQTKKIGIGKCLDRLPRDGDTYAIGSQPVPRPRRDMKNAQLAVDAQTLGLGRLYVAPGARSEFKKAGFDVGILLKRHAAGDWGDICKDDRNKNDDAIRNRNRTYSTYTLSPTVSIWIITDGDRKATGVFLPDEFR
jgi:hypothetical protein